MGYIPNKNYVHLRGTIGKMSETKQLGGGAFVVQFTLATSESFKNKDTDKWESRTEWHTIVVWNDKNAVGLSKGDAVDLEGKLKSKEYETKQGEKKRQIYIQVDRIFKIPKEYGGGQQDSSAADEDIPI